MSLKQFTAWQLKTVVSRADLLYQGKDPRAVILAFMCEHVQAFKLIVLEVIKDFSKLS